MTRTEFLALGVRDDRSSVFIGRHNGGLYYSNYHGKRRDAGGPSIGYQCYREAPACRMALRLGIVETAHTEKSFRNIIKSNRN